MTRVEMQTFENEETLLAAIKTAIAGKEASRTYTKDGEEKKVKLISNNRIYLGNNWSIGFSKDNNGKIYMSTDFFTVDDRIAVAKSKKVETTNL